MLRATLIGCLLVCCPTIAAADEVPWAAGVSEERKTQAQKLLEEGNARLVERDYATALAKYEAAVAQWDHPAIRFNIVRCLIQLDRPLEAAKNLELALKYGAKPLEEDVYNEALSYQKLLGNQIGEVSISCTQAGVKLDFDAKPLGTCPFKEKRHVIAGPHQLVATKDGFLTRTFDLSISGSKTSEVGVELEPLSKAARIVRRYPTWMPWFVFGGGFIVGGVGGLLQWKASNDLDQYESNVDGCGPMGCADDKFGGQRDSALRLNKVAIGVMIAGGATVATGAVLLYMNRGRTVYNESREQKSSVVVVPTEDGAMAAWSGRF